MRYSYHLPVVVSGGFVTGFTALYDYGVALLVIFFSLVVDEFPHGRRRWYPYDPA